MRLMEDTKMYKDGKELSYAYVEHLRKLVDEGALFVEAKLGHDEQGNLVLTVRFM